MGIRKDNTKILQSIIRVVVVATQLVRSPGQALSFTEDLDRRHEMIVLQHCQIWSG
jgi:hypothetical protein